MPCSMLASFLILRRQRWKWLSTPVVTTPLIPRVRYCISRFSKQSSCAVKVYCTNRPDFMGVVPNYSVRVSSCATTIRQQWRCCNWHESKRFITADRRRMIRATQPLRAERFAVAVCCYIYITWVTAVTDRGLSGRVTCCRCGSSLHTDTN